MWIAAFYSGRSDFLNDVREWRSDGVLARCFTAQLIKLDLIHKLSEAILLASEILGRADGFLRYRTKEYHLSDLSSLSS